VFVRNPDSTDAAATALSVGQTTHGINIADSGVINYINKFGQMTSADHKSYDPVSELFYTALRYLKNQGNVSAYTTLSGTPDQNYIYADGFPVITDWDDPMQYRCQKNALLGIGDVFTWYDKNLPDNSVLTNEPTSRAADTSVNVVTATERVATLEGITIATPFNAGRQSSAFIAGLAYDAHTRDLRSDLTDMQTASTYWVDVREGGTIAGRTANPYWLATKYGGFTVPANFEPYAENPAPLALSSWSSGEDLAASYPRPKNFFVASEADKMVESLSRAFARIASETVGSGTGLTSNSTRLGSDTLTFQAQFKSGSWSGEVQAFRVRTDGSISPTPLWKATTAMATAPWASRPIYFHNPQGNSASRHSPFIWDNLNADQKAALGTQQVVDYLRGDRTLEEDRNNGLFRTRTEILGDIVNSTPMFVGTPNSNLHLGATFTGASSYPAFVAAKSSRTPVLYVGANDGMLHGFNANTGAETYAFVPDAAIVNGLRSYSNPSYNHRYFVDGEMTVADVYYGNSWKTVLVGSMGRGGPGVFALDVTDPSNVQFLWEKSGTNIAALGKNLGRPVIAQVADGQWSVILGNGPGSTAAAAQLVMISIPSDAVTVANTGATGSNGLTAVLARDTNGDRFADTAYAGDLRGNLWKFSGLSGTPGASKIFEARDPNGAEQPITAAPMVGKDPDTGITWVFFGTGRYLDEADLIDRQVQTWYGIKDTGSSMATRSDLVQRDILAEGTVGQTPVRVVEAGSAVDLEGRRGWFMDLVSPGTGGVQGERIVLPNRFQGKVLIGTTNIPDARDACAPSGRSWVMAINPFTGARLDRTFFDASLDGEFTTEDTLNGVIGSGVGFDPGLGGNAGFVEHVMQTGLTDGTMPTMETQGGAAEAGRMSWRELLN
jgi:type IV pilus assembly protein PilY1